MLRSLALLAIVPTTLMYDGMPPPRFAHPADHPVRIIYGRVDKCGKAHAPGHPNAYFASCIRRGVTYLPDPCAYGAKEEFARLACHEIAHMNLWPADHGE